MLIGFAYNEEKNGAALQSVTSFFCTSQLPIHLGIITLTRYSTSYNLQSFSNNNIIYILLERAFNGLSKIYGC